MKSIAVCVLIAILYGCAFAAHDQYVEITLWDADNCDNASLAVLSAFLPLNDCVYDGNDGAFDLYGIIKLESDNITGYTCTDKKCKENCTAWFTEALSPCSAQYSEGTAIAVVDKIAPAVPDTPSVAVQIFDDSGCQDLDITFLVYIAGTCFAHESNVTQALLNHPLLSNLQLSPLVWMPRIREQALDLRANKYHSEITRCPSKDRVQVSYCEDTHCHHHCNTTTVQKLPTTCDTPFPEWTTASYILTECLVIS